MSRNSSSLQLKAAMISVLEANVKDPPVAFAPLLAEGAAPRRSRDNMTLSTRSKRKVSVQP